MENLISENLYIFEEPELKSIKDAVQEVLDVYAREVMGIPQQLYVTQSWSLTNKANVGMHGHSHSNSVLSGSLYYCELPTPPSGMVFTRHVTYQQIDLAPEREKRNVYNSPIKPDHTAAGRCAAVLIAPHPYGRAQPVPPAASFHRLQHVRQRQAGQLPRRVGTDAVAAAPRAWTRARSRGGKSSRPGLILQCVSLSSIRPHVSRHE